MFPHDVLASALQRKGAVRDQIRDVVDRKYVTVEVEYVFVLRHIEDHTAVVQAPVNRTALVFASKSECFKCHTPKPVAGG